MPISYNKLWKLMIDKKMNKTQLKEASKVSGATIAKLGKEEPISMESMLKICKVLDCNIGDIVEIVDEVN
ncbi:MAG: helix-turn-helix transcriptional regulator [Oscillospiraceae bacterium]|jgi:DNA-binding Xre family transcriptional regulator|nr:helix-turn-helix transcriptional regulator [Oscillospiraceae bacterium]